MREQLKRMEEQRKRFTGTFVRFGQKSGWKGYSLTTVLLSDIKDEYGKDVSDHLWFNLTKEFQKLKLEDGTVVEFHARVKEYVKGYRGYREDVYDKPCEIDYKLSHPTKLRILKAVTVGDGLKKFCRVIL